MPVNQRVSAPWSSPFCWSDSRLHATGLGSFHSPTLLTGFVGECSFVGEFGVSLESALQCLFFCHQLGVNTFHIIVQVTGTDTFIHPACCPVYDGLYVITNYNRDQVVMTVNDLIPILVHELSTVSPDLGCLESPSAGIKVK